MKRVLSVFFGFTIALFFFMTVYAKDCDATLSDEKSELKVDTDLRVDTVMYAKGHAFGYSGDISMWGGWYLDTVCIGYDNMLQYKTVGPSTLKLSFVTRELTVDLGDADVVEKIQRFMEPIDGFKRFRKRYSESIDSIYYEDEGYYSFIGGFSFEVDYPDNCNENYGKINRFICELANISETESAKVSSLSAFYAGFNQTKKIRQEYYGNKDDIQNLSDFLAHRTFDNWKYGGGCGLGLCEVALAIRPHVSDKRYITFSKYEYEREGFGHGMYTETFHTFDMKNGKRLKNKDIFKTKSLDNVKLKLFEVMANDPHYLEWHGESVSASEIESMIEAWQSPDLALEGTEWEEPKKDFKFDLPDGALTESGIIFSFQPYEIDCWAAGAYHFIVPYEKLMPYLTSDAKKLINAGK